MCPPKLLSAERAFTYADLHAMLGNRNTILWLTPHAAVAREGGGVVYSWERLCESRCSSFNVDGKRIVVLARSLEHLSGMCDVVLRLLTASVVHQIILEEEGRWGLESSCVVINAATLANLMEKCQTLKVLSLTNVEFDENGCRALGTYSRPGLDIELTCCRITDAAAEALAEVLGSNQGPTKIYCCKIDSFAIANGLRGNTRLKSLNLAIGDDRECLAIAGALKENKGLFDLDLRHKFMMRDETWDAVCDSLKTHPTLHVLSLKCLPILKSRIHALVEMVKVNMSIHTLHLNSCYSEHELYRESVIPYLETNRFRLRVRAIQRTRPIAYRAKVLGRALLGVRTNPNSFWMLLSGNAEVVALSSTTATTTPASRFCRRFFKCCYRFLYKLSITSSALLVACTYDMTASGIGSVFMTASENAGSLRGRSLHALHHPLPEWQERRNDTIS
jgi:hypothetical protein